MIKKIDMSHLSEKSKLRYEQQYQRAEKAINVGQLIEKLKEYPQDLPVIVDYDFIEGFKIQNEWPLGDPASPYGCAECTVLIIE